MKIAALAIALVSLAIVASGFSRTSRPGPIGPGARAGPEGPALQITVPTYTKDIAPLIADRCGMCHDAGGAAPFSLLSYADVKRHATQITTVTRSRFMPPWKADPDNGPFVGQHPLSDAEIHVLQQWVDEGAIEGDPRPAHTPRWTEGWQLG